MNDLHNQAEDACGKPVATEKALTPDALRAGGLAQVQIWMYTSKPSKAAGRAKAYKERLAAQGIRQINVLAPEPAQPVLKAIAECTTQGQEVQQVLRNLAGVSDEEERLAGLGRKVESMRGLRRWLVMWFLS